MLVLMCGHSLAIDKGQLLAFHEFWLRPFIADDYSTIKNPPPHVLVYLVGYRGCS